MTIKYDAREELGNMQCSAPYGIYKIPGRKRGLLSQLIPSGNSQVVPADASSAFSKDVESSASGVHIHQVSQVCPGEPTCSSQYTCTSSGVFSHVHPKIPYQLFQANSGIQE